MIVFNFFKAILHPIDEKLLEEENLTAAADQKRYIQDFLYTGYEENLSEN